MTVPSDLVPLAQALLKDRRTGDRLAAFIADTWAARAGRNANELEREIDAGSDYATLTVRSPYYQIDVTQGWGLSVGLAFSNCEIQVLPGGKAVTWLGEPVDQAVAADHGFDLAALQNLVEIASDAQGYFAEWFIEEAAAGRMELWGARGSELAPRERIPPHALGIGSKSATIDFANATLTTAVRGEVVYALALRWSDQVEAKSPPAKGSTESKPTGQTMLAHILESRDRCIRNPELEKWWTEVNGKAASYDAAKKEAIKELEKLNPKLAREYTKYDSSSKRLSKHTAK